MKYINTGTGEYPVSRRDIVNSFPTASFPKDRYDFEEYGYHLVYDTIKPVGDVVMSGEPELVEGRYLKSWIVRAHTEEEEVSLIEKAKEAKAVSILSDYTTSMSSITDVYDSVERETWGEQKRESLAVKAGETGVLLMLDAMASEQGVDRDVVATGILKKADAFSAISGSLLGTKKKRTTALAAIDLTALDALTQIEEI